MELIRLIWFKKKKSDLILKAQEANELLQALGIEEHTESGKEVRTAIAMELLGQKYDLMAKHSKAVFIKQHKPELEAIREYLQNEGVLSKQKKPQIKESST
jgi:roadblock/LC7 domain-containing protein